MRYRRRAKVTCAIASVSAAAAVAAACVSSSNPLPAASLDGGTSDDGAAASSGNDAAIDAGSDVALPPNDAGPDAMDSATAPDAAEGGCSPVSVAGFVPPAYVPASGELQLFCQTTAQLQAQQALYTACFGDAATSATCSGLDAGDAAPCATCIVTSESAAAYGPVVERVVPTLNLAGCIQMADPSDAGATCARAVQAAEACVEAACKAACPVVDLPSQDAYVACTKAAAAGGCASFATTAAACLGAELGDAGNGPAGPNCYAPTDQAEYTQVTTFFCGS